MLIILFLKPFLYLQIFFNEQVLTSGKKQLWKG